MKIRLFHPLWPLIVAVSSGLAQAPAEPVAPKLEQLMRSSEIKEMGLDKLTPEEAQKLAGWLAAFKNRGASPVKSAAVQGNPAPGSLAHFRFDGDAKDANAGNPPFNLFNTEFKDNALCLNGKYEYTKERDGYRAVCSTPKLDYNKFTVALRFKAEDFEDKASTLLVGGTSYRWLRIARSRAGNLTVRLGSKGFYHEIEKAPLKPETWTVVAFGVDLVARKASVYFNGQKVAALDIPEGFKLEVAESDARDRDKVWTFTDYSFGGTFHGLVDELIIYGDRLSDDAMARIPLTPVALSSLTAATPVVAASAPPPKIALPINPTPFLISSLKSSFFSVGGEFAGTYQLENEKLVIKVSNGKIVAQNGFDHLDIVGVRAIVTAPPEGRGGFRVPASSVQFPVGKVIAKNDPFLLEKVTFEIPMESARGVQNLGLGFEFAVRSANGSIGTCYAHMATFLDGRKR